MFPPLSLSGGPTLFSNARFFHFLFHSGITGVLLTAGLFFGNAIQPALGQTEPPSKPTLSTPQSKESAQSGTSLKSVAENEPESESTIKIEATLVTVPVIVSDKNGVYKPGLRSEQFQVSEDGVKQEISFFSAEAVPIQVALLVDVSRSSFLNLDHMKMAAKAFVDQLRDQDQAALFTFAGDFQELCPFTSDRKALKAAIDRMELANYTFLFEAIYHTLNHYLKPLQGRKALIMLTDGIPSGSVFKVSDWAIQAAKECDALIYVLRYPEGIQKDAKNKPIPGIAASPGFVSKMGEYLKDLAKPTGGQVFAVDSVGTLQTLFSRIAAELRNIYTVGYYPSNQSTKPGFRKLKVKVEESGARVRAREGYFLKGPGAPSART